MASCGGVEEMIKRTHKYGHLKKTGHWGKRDESSLRPWAESSIWVLGALEIVGPQEGHIPSCEPKYELMHRAGVQLHWPCLTLTHVLTTADPPRVPCPDLSVSEWKHHTAQLSSTTPMGPSSQALSLPSGMCLMGTTSGNTRWILFCWPITSLRVTSLESARPDDPRLRGKARSGDQPYSKRTPWTQVSRASGGLSSSPLQHATLCPT